MGCIFPTFSAPPVIKLYVRSKKVRKAQNGTGMDFLSLSPWLRLHMLLVAKGLMFFDCLSVMLLIGTCMGDSVPIKPFEFRNGFDVSR